MGSVASCAFLQTVYDQLHATPDGEFPCVSYLSDPSAPSRSSGNEQALSAFIVRQVETLLALGATDNALCCMIAHSLDLPDWRGFHSLKQVLRRVVEENKGNKPLLVGSRMFFSDPSVRQALLGSSMLKALPSPGDADRFFSVYDEVKINRLTTGSLEFFRSFAERNADRSVILCCSEFHLLVRAMRDTPLVNVIDLTILARQLGAQSRCVTP